MDKITIIETLAGNLDPFGKAALKILKNQEVPIAKQEIGALINQQWEERKRRQQQEGNESNNDQKAPVSSRYTLDIGIARLEGAGLIILHKLGQAKPYRISPLGKIVFEHIKRSRQ